MASESLIYSIAVYKPGQHWTEPPARKPLLWSDAIFHRIQYLSDLERAREAAKVGG